MMRTLFIMIISTLAFLPIYAQDDPEPKVFTIVEIQPKFPGGEEALFQFLAENTQYPDKAKDAGIQGVVYVQFIVLENGEIADDVTVLKGVHPTLDNEAIRVVKIMPQWEPGYQHGKPVRVYYKLPFRFTLRNDEPEESNGFFKWLFGG